ncbi:protein translocase subunit SecD [Candidatus Berkelbacteria bacterium]|nr:protein translocase subunit SecD [Candidatus Berkelbacteria bacterium]
MRRRSWWTLLGILAITALAVMAIWPTDIWFIRDIRIHPGLDLQGGTQLVYELKTADIPESDRKEAIEGVREAIVRRVDAFGVNEPVIQASRVSGRDVVIVELPGIKDVNQAKELIGKTAKLEFYESSAEGESGAIETFFGFFKPTSLTGADLKRAQVTFDSGSNSIGGAPLVQIQFNDEGKEKFKALTEAHVDEQIAVFLDGEIITAPTVQTAITDGVAIITGDFELAGAKELAIQLNAGALPVSVALVEERTIGATLGTESVQKSLFAGLVGLILVGLFMILNYRLMGLIATLALLLYTLFTLAIFEWLGITLSLAGIAGFILSIGMAVDANILIFERIREELRGESPMNLAINEGFRRAWSSIFDSNVSSLITATILYYTATGLVRGFAVTLALGILVSMFTAITVSRTFLRLILRERRVKA